MESLKGLIKACDKALVTCDKTIKAKDKVIKHQGTLLNQVTRDLNSELERSSKWYNSKELWFVLGALFTGVLVGVAK